MIRSSIMRRRCIPRAACRVFSGHTYGSRHENDAESLRPLLEGSVDNGSWCGAADADGVLPAGPQCAGPASGCPS